MMIHKEVQGTLAWYQLRLGKPTASNFHRIITPGGKPSSQARAYMYKLICEILLNESTDDISQLDWVARGKEQEPNAAAQFKFTTDYELEDGGFITTDDGKLGCSPDALIRDKNEAVEIKSPAPWTQIGYLIDGPGDSYRPQVQGQLLVGQFDGVHFYSWHPQTPALHIMTRPDMVYQRLMRQLLSDFVEQLEEGLERAKRCGQFLQLARSVVDKAYPEAGEEEGVVV